MNMNNMMNYQMGMNNMMNNQMNMNNMMNNQMGMNNIMNNICVDKNEVKNPRKKNNKNTQRKVPPILEKNANIKIESITFKVENGLKPTKDLYRT